MRRLALFAAALLLSGCDTYHYLAGTFSEDWRKPQGALKHYEAFLERRPRDPRSCEMRLRAGELYRTVFGRCGEARRHYEAAIRDFPAMPACAERAHAGLLSCPDFFPLDPGRTWVFVDSQTKGRAMRLEWEARPSTGAASGALTTALYAGDRRVRADSERFEKADWAVWRVEGKGREAVLRYPYAKGQAWTARRDKARLSYEVVSDAEEVRVQAGAFSGCLKVKETDARFPKTWRFDYYCPGVGRVKTTLGGPGWENPNAELLKYDGLSTGR